jgi:hypothetical protein
LKFGQVSLADGSSLDAGQIWFTPAKGQSGVAAAGRIRNGQYRIPAEIGPQAGVYDVRITTGEPPGSPAAARNSTGQDPLPKRDSYRFPGVQVQESTDALDFVLSPEDIVPPLKRRKTIGRPAAS